MPTNIEWDLRVKNWHDSLPNHFYTKIADVELVGFTTMDQLTVQEAIKKACKPFPKDTKWGKKWEYAWHKFTVKVPKEAKGQRIVIRLNIGQESSIYINGKNAGARDFGRSELTLTRNAKGEETFEVMVESYAGHGPVHCFLKPDCATNIDELMFTPDKQQEIGDNSFGIWNEDIYLLWLEMNMVKELAENTDSEGILRSECLEALRNVTFVVDFEDGTLLDGAKKGRKILEPILKAKNGSIAPEFFAFGHSHIDVAWLWPLRETEAKCTRTFATALALMDEYPDYKFLQSQPHLYQMVKTSYPDLYKSIKQKIKEGQWIADGGMWVEADTNVSSGESLIRQFLYGKKFFKQEFGIENELLWLPDVFGYTGALPQIMTGCGIKYFSTQKIYWAYNGGEPFPYTNFIWEGIDGSQVLASFHNDYNSHTNPASLITRWTERKQKVGIKTRLQPFGYGDGGGGVTRDHLEYLKRSKDLQGVPKVKQAAPQEYFEDLEKQNNVTDKYVGELYFQCHRGVLTSQARTKQGNRRCEQILREAECWSAFASTFYKGNYPANELETAWKEVLLNQFHDIIPGSSITRVYDDAAKGYKRAYDAATNFTTKAISKIVKGDKNALTVFNSLSYPRNMIVEVDWKGATDTDGNEIPVIDGLAEVTVPPCGFITIKASKNAATIKSTIKATAKSLENELISVKFNAAGEITEIMDKETGVNLIAGRGNEMCLYKDYPVAFEAWDIDQTYEYQKMELNGKATFELVVNNTLLATIKITKMVNDSELVQFVTIKRNSRRIDFDTKINWIEKHKMLKVAFPVNIHTNEAINEIQFGYIKRPNHRSREFDSDRFEVSQYRYTAMKEENQGVAILNDCKYGVNMVDNSIKVTLLRSPMGPDPIADQGTQEFKYSFYAWNGAFINSNILAEAADINTPKTICAGDSGTYSFLKIADSNISIDTIKVAEDGSGDIVVRLYEGLGAKTSTNLYAKGAVSAVETNLLEEENGAITVIDCDCGCIYKRKIGLNFRPFEIKTLKIKMK